MLPRKLIELELAANATLAWGQVAKGRGHYLFSPACKHGASGAGSLCWVFPYRPTITPDGFTGIYRLVDGSGDENAAVL